MHAVSSTNNEPATGRHHRRLNRVIASLGILSLLLTAILGGVLVFEMRALERLDEHGQSGRMMTPEFSEGNYRSIRKVTIDYLENLASTEDFAHDVCRTEKWLRGFGKSKPLNHSHNRLGIGLLMGKPEPSSPAFHAVVGYVSRYLRSDGTFSVEPKEVDDYALGLILLEMHHRTGDSRYMAGARHLAEELINHRKKNSLGSIPYRAKYPECMVVDDKGMICSFLVRYGIMANDSRATDLGVLQLTTFLDHAINPSNHQPYHGYDIEKQECFGPATWLRGSGWLAMGLAETLQWLPENHGARSKIQKALEAQISGLEAWQLRDGTWRWDINNPWARIDTSGTAMIGYAILLAQKHGDLDKRYAPMAEKALRGILLHTHEDGTVDDAQLGCKGIGHYPVLFGPSNTVQGPTLALFNLHRQLQPQP